MSSTETIAPIRVAVTVAVSPERAWEVFTAQMADWWPLHTHSIAAFEGSVPDRLVVEPGVGGEIYEQTGGVRRHWARFDSWQPPRRLSYTWRVNPENPPTNVAVTFDPVEGGTRVEIVHSGWEAYADAGVTRASYGSAGGWELVAASFASALD